MNNEQFRRLLFDNPKPPTTTTTTTSPSPSPLTTKPKSASPADKSSPRNGPATAGSGGGTTGILGSRMRSSIPMTPRAVTKPDFARQLADYRRESSQSQSQLQSGQPPTKKFRSSAAPKGSKLPAGYLDRAARLREINAAAGAGGGAGKGQEEEEEDDDTNNGKGEGEGISEVEKKLKELEERFKKGEIDEETFLRLRRELGVGGDLGSTHMVKGLDWELLRRVKAGEDVSVSVSDARTVEAGEGGREEAEEVDVDEEFDRVLEGKEGEGLPSAPKVKEKEKKKGSLVQRKTRDEILRELKASRAAAAAAEANANATAEPALGTRFKKIGESKVEKKRWIEQDENGRRREVLLITDAEGKTKRKVRWIDKPGEAGPMPAREKEAKPLGMEVPAEVAAKAKAAEEEKDDDGDIFEGVGADYNPLEDAASDGSSESDEDEGEVTTTKAPTTAEKTPTQGETQTTAKPRNYFATTATEKKAEEVEPDRANPLTKDPVLLAALKRAAALRQASPSQTAGEQGADEEVDSETLLRRRKFLEEAQRREELDAMDLDYGFGGSRIEDDEDDEAVLLEGGGKKRKRGPKKKKGDKDSASDVLQVLEGRKKAA